MKEDSILITGGTGSFGKAFVAEILRQKPNIRRLVIFSRDELKQYEMSKIYSTNDFPGLRYFIGDIRDEKRLLNAFKGIDTVIHAAALKQVPAGEYNPSEFINTNIYGSENVLNAATFSGVKKVIALSTDKASSPSTLYGATKLCSDRLFIAGNNFTGNSGIHFSLVRYGNVFGSRGSVVPLFLNQQKTGTLQVTHPDMTRFSITLKEGVEVVFKAMKMSFGGEIFVPKLPSYRILDLAKAIGPDCEIEITGTRPGEKLHEQMISLNDGEMIFDIGNEFVIINSSVEGAVDHYKKIYGKDKIIKSFDYTSDKNKVFLTVEQIKNLVNSEQVNM